MKSTTTTRQKPKKTRPAAGHSARNGRGRSLLAPTAAIRLPAAAGGQKKATPPREAALRQADVPLAAIDRSPWQVRQAFPEAEIAELAGRLAALGQIVPVLLRPAADDGPGLYELLDGERRLRAARSLGWETIRAEVGDFSDAEARSIVLEAGSGQKPLNPIERAMGVQAKLDAGDAATITELAVQMHVAQGTLSKQLALLKLPEPWRRRVVSGELPPSHAYELARYAEYPGILAAAEQSFGDVLDEAGGPGSIEHFRRWVVQAAMFDATQPMSGTEQTQATNYRPVPIFRPTEADREKLGVIEVERERWSGGKKKRETEQRATNVALWDELQAAHRAAIDAKKAGGGRLEAGGKKGVQAKPGAAKREPTAAEKRRLAEEEARREKEAAKQTARRVEELAVDWARELIAAEILQADRTAIDRILTWALTADVHRRLRQTIADGLVAAGIKIRRGPWGDYDLLKPILEMETTSLFDDLQRAALAALFCSPHADGGKGGPVTAVDPKQVRLIADLLAIDFEAAWKLDQAGAESERYWAAHTKAQLVDLAGELGVGVSAGLAAGATKAEAVAFFVARRGDKKHPLAMPKELRKAIKKAA